MGSEFRYDAFISYRHTELDKFVAENLHKQLESFRLPKSIAKKRPGQKNKIERVFRDKEELPLTSNLEDPILQALNSSEWLIVICSPRLRESMWCKKEIETFVNLRGRERVLAVLIEGEPAESFPDELLFKTEKHTLPDGTVEEIKIPVEPLAADVRGKNKKEVLKAMKTEVMRLLAAMFQLNYDDLRQRHKERRMRRIMTASLIGGAACLAFGVYSTATALRIQKQKEQIEAQSEEIKAQSEEIKTQSEEIQKQNEELSLRQARSLAELATRYLEDGNRADAIKTAVEALTESDGIALPYTTEAQFVLAESVRAYDTGNVYRAEYQYETAGRIDSIKISYDQDTLSIYDDTETLTLYDLENREEILVIGSNDYGRFGDYGCTFLGDDKFVYYNTNDKLCIYDLNERSIVKQIEIEYFSEVFADKGGKYLVVEQWDRTFMVYDGTTFELLGTIADVPSGVYTDGPYVFSEGIMAYSASKEGTTDSEEYTLYFFDLNTMETISTYEMGVKQIKNLVIADGKAYIASGEYGDLYMNCDSYVTVVDITSGSLVWEYEKENYYPYDIKTPMYEGGTQILFVTDSNVMLLDENTGEVTLESPLPSNVVSSYVNSAANFYLMYCETGELIVADEDYEQTMDMSHLFECKTQSNEEVLHSRHGIVVQERNDNKITVYTQMAGPDVVEIEEKISYPEESGEIIGESVMEIVRSYGLERPEFVRSLYYSEDEKYCFIEYWDYDVAIYDVSAGKLLNTIEDAYPTEWCKGTDADGYTYLLGYYGIYVLDSEMKPVMWLPQAIDIDLENRIVYLGWNTKYYKAPLYNTEELLVMAQSYGEQGE